MVTLGGCEGEQQLCHTPGWRKAKGRISGIYLIWGQVVRERQSWGSPWGCARAAPWVELCQVFLQALGRGWSQHVVRAAALDAQRCCVPIPTQSFGNFLPLDFSHLFLPLLHPRATGMQLCGCWIQRWSSPVTLGDGSTSKMGLQKSKSNLKKIRITHLNQLNTYKTLN